MLNSAQQKYFNQFLFLIISVSVVAYLFYGGLYPFDSWINANSQCMALLKKNATHKVFTFDIIQNLIFFIPLGFCWLIIFNKITKNIFISIILTIIFGASISFSIEYLQCFNPKRTPSALDLLLNTISTFMGAILAWLYLIFHHHNKTFWKNNLQTTTYSNLGIIAGAVTIGWLGFELWPLVPTLKPSNINPSINNLINFNFTKFDFNLFSKYFLIGIIGHLLLLTIFKLENIIIFIFFVILLFAAGKFIMLEQPLYSESIMGLLIGAFTTNAALKACSSP